MDQPQSSGEAKSKTDRILMLIDEVRAARAVGKQVDAQAIKRAHEDLMPELGHQLDNLARIEAARIAAAMEASGDGRAGPADERTLASLLRKTEEGSRSESQSSGGSRAISIPGYKFTNEVARGGQGIVFDARHEATGRRVALKLLFGTKSGTHDQARFDREVQILAALRHPNIIDIIDRGTLDDGSFFIVMPFIPGRPLDTWMTLHREHHADKSDGADFGEVLQVFVKVCDAVNAAHLRGVVHRDLKPSNIVIDEESEPHILDFGLAKTAFDSESVGPMTMTGQFMGSLPWASPEQAEGQSKNVDTRSDVYSLGVILYQMLTGTFPYQVAGTMRDVLNNIVTAQPPPPSSVLSKVTGAKKPYKNKRLPKSVLNVTIDAIVLKALAKRREDRYQNAGEMAKDIERYLAGKPVMAEDGGKTSPEVRFRPWMIAGIIVAVIIIAASIAANRWFATLSPSRPAPVSKDQKAVDSPGAQAAPPLLADPQSLPSKVGGSWVNSIGMKFVYVPAGEFMMGSPEGEFGRSSDETQHKVRITKPFLMGVTEVTQGQWKAVMMGINPSRFKESDDLPVENISWNDAREFCTRLEKKDGRKYRLPTEAEWEYACRAGTTTLYYAGSTEAALADTAWYANGGRDMGTHAVAQKKPNAWGLHDMHGNVWEWCEDWYGKYSGLEETDPTGPAEGITRVARGGSWNYPSDRCRAATRPPQGTHTTPDYHASAIGFRIVSPLPADNGKISASENANPFVGMKQLNLTSDTYQPKWISYFPESTADTIHLVGDRFGDLEFKAISRMRNLTAVNLTDTKIEKDGFRDLLAAPHLASLLIHTGPSLLALGRPFKDASTPRLLDLHLIGPMSLEDIEDIVRAAPILSSITILNSGITDRQLAALGDISQLEGLTLHDPAVGFAKDTDLANLQRLKNLKRFELHNFDGIRQLAPRLSALPKLTKTFFFYGPIGDQDAESFAQSPSIENLTFEHVKMSDHALSLLQNLKSLKELRITASTGMTRPAMVDFARARPDVLFRVENKPFNPN